jgi:hypothetical protein
MTKREQEDYRRTRERFHAMAPTATADDYDTLRRAGLTLRRWYERECGDAYGNAIERDDDTGIPYQTYDGANGTRKRYRIPDRERGALARVSAVCSRLGLYHYLQTDPRGGTLYVSTDPIDDTNYNRGLYVW